MTKTIGSVFSPNTVDGDIVWTRSFKYMRH